MKFRNLLIAILLALNTLSLGTASAQPSGETISNSCGLAQPCGALVADLTDGTYAGTFTSARATESLRLSSETVAGAGTTVADAAQLSATKIVHQITGANGTVGWKMSASMPVDSVQILLNTTAGVAKIYAESGGTVNGGSADAAFTALTGIKPIICVKTAALTYLCS